MHNHILDFENSKLYTFWAQDTNSSRAHLNVSLIATLTIGTFHQWISGMLQNVEGKL
uniref:Uncharacterized protein n=1 Tax=Arundo donax TaxID=35708 RepID=A0A0A9BGX7_ARUDO